ncbi:hypothetical protein [Pseudonocardia sp. H11422]|uniref:hypothetical protein n=1 Tax=Pseudonocardia sp. H11422 TaxID=2835866 RepID=UPI0020280369|nr:hypothetical protein [Pseudonocardia sp. H11422]
MNPVLTTGELAKQLCAARPTVIVTAQPAADKTTEIADAAGIAHRFVIGEAAGFRPFAELTGPGEPVPRPVLDPRTAVAALPFSAAPPAWPRASC